VCVRKCLIKAPLTANAFPQPGSAHTNGFSPVCVRKCFVKTSLLANAFPQPGSAHTNGFSPVCVRKCTFKSPLRANAFPQPGSAQINGFSPVCVRKCLVKLPFSAYAFPQPGTAHTNGFHPYALENGEPALQPTQNLCHNVAQYKRVSLLASMSYRCAFERVSSNYNCPHTPSRSLVLNTQTVFPLYALGNE
jgi:hypothetical protein